MRRYVHVGTVISKANELMFWMTHLRSNFGFSADIFKHINRMNAMIVYNFLKFAENWKLHRLSRFERNSSQRQSNWYFQCHLWKSVIDRIVLNLNSVCENACELKVKITQYLKYSDLQHSFYAIMSQNIDANDISNKRSNKTVNIYELFIESFFQSNSNSTHWRLFLRSIANNNRSYVQ